MVQTSSKLLIGLEGGRLMYWCQACDIAHGVAVGEGPGPRWEYNGRPETPTFLPSVLVVYPAHPNAEERFKEWRTERRCHTYIVDGMVHFLNDCTHELAGQILPLPDLKKSLELT